MVKTLFLLILFFVPLRLDNTVRKQGMYLK